MLARVLASPRVDLSPSGGRVPTRLQNREREDELDAQAYVVARVMAENSDDDDAGAEDDAAGGPIRRRCARSVLPVRHAA